MLKRAESRGLGLGAEVPAVTARGSEPGAHPWIPSLPTSTLMQIVLLSGIFVLNFFPGTDPDLWWHLSTGRYIMETGSIPMVDPFSYTAVGRPWVAHEWLAEVILFLLYRSGGYLVLVLLTGTTITVTFWVVLRTLKLLGLRPVAATLVTAWVAAMSLFAWNVRPQMFSYLMFSIYLYLLLRSRQHPDRRLWLLPVLMIPWVNLHAGYITGLLLLGSFLVGEGINRWIATGRRGDGVAGRSPGAGSPGSGAGEWKLSALGTQHPGLSTQGSELDTQNPELRRPHPSIRTYLAVTAATVAATMLNPHGPAMLLYPLSYAGTQNASMKYISEWQSPDFHYYYFFVFGVSLMVLMAVPMRRRVDWATTFPLLALTAMSLQSVRVIAFYSIAVAPVLAMRLVGYQGPGVMGHWAGDGTLVLPSALGTQSAALGSRSSAGTRWNWLVLALCLATMASTLFISDRTQWGPEPRTAGYPAAGVQYLRESGLQGRLLNTFHWGGFVIWSFYPERRVFIDGRPDMYGDSFMDDYGKLQDAKPGWKEVLDRYHVEVALLDKDSRTATLLLASGDWQEVFRGDVEVVLVRSR